MSQITRLVPTSGPGSGTVTSVSGGNNITITGDPTVNPTVNVSGTTNHAVQVGNASGSLTSLAVGTTGQILTGVTGSDPVWASPAAGGVTSITGNTGGAQTGAINLVTANSTPIFAGSAGTITLDFGLTSNLILGSNATALVGPENVAYGQHSGQNLVNGGSNSFFGFEAGLLYTTGNESVAIGANSMSAAVAGAGLNTAVGALSLQNMAGAGVENVALGYNAGGNYLTTENNNIIIGANNVGTIGDAGVIRIGLNGAQTKAFVAGIAGVNVGSVATVVTESGDQLGTATITAGSGISVTPGANTITIANTASSSISITGDSGGALSGSAFTFTGGTTGLTFAGAGSTETLGGTLAIANGGTNATSMATTDGVVYYDGTRLVTTSAGTAAQVLTSNGAGVAPTYQAAGGAGLLTASVTLTNSQIKNLHGTPVQAIAAPGAGNVIWPISIVGKMIYGGSNVFTAAAGQFIALMYAPVGNNNRPFNSIQNAAITAASSSYTLNNTYTTTTAVSTQYENAALQFYVTSATEISGNAANDNTMSFQIIYKIITL